MNKNKISVCIPCYNSEKTIEKCLESILNQSYPFFDIIVVDDGSTDHTKNILYNYSVKDQRVHYYHSQHLGENQTRKKCFVNSIEYKNQFLCFIDSDDIIEKDFFSNLIFEQNKNDYDIVVSNIQNSVSINKRILNNVTNYIEFLLNDAVPSGLCFKLIKMSVVSDNDFALDLPINADVVAHLNISSRCTKIITIPYDGYKYLDNPISVTHTITKSNKIVALLKARYFMMESNNNKKHRYILLSSYCRIYAGAYPYIVDFRSIFKPSIWSLIRSIPVSCKYDKKYFIRILFIICLPKLYKKIILRLKVKGV